MLSYYIFGYNYFIMILLAYAISLSPPSSLQTTLITSTQSNTQSTSNTSGNSAASPPSNDSFSPTPSPTRTRKRQSTQLLILDENIDELVDTARNNNVSVRI